MQCNTSATQMQRVGNAEKEIEKDIEKKKSKETKIALGEYFNVKLTPSEHDKLIKEYGVDLTKECITFLDEYIEMKGYKAKSHYLCIRKWVLNAVKERKVKNKPITNSTFNNIESRNEEADFFRGLIDNE